MNVIWECHSDGHSLVNKQASKQLVHVLLGHFMRCLKIEGWGYILSLGVCRATWQRLFHICRGTNINTVCPVIVLEYQLIIVQVCKRSLELRRLLLYVLMQSQNSLPCRKTPVAANTVYTTVSVSPPPVYVEVYRGGSRGASPNWGRSRTPLGLWAVIQYTECTNFLEAMFKMIL